MGLWSDVYIVYNEQLLIKKSLIYLGACVDHGVTITIKDVLYYCTVLLIGIAHQK